MARPPQDAIDTFKDITGASEDVAVLKLEEHEGDLNAAINAHFSEADLMNMQDHSHSNAHLMDVDVPMNLEQVPSRFPRSHLDPFSLISSFLPPHGLVASFQNNGEPQVSHPRERREIPIEISDGSGGHSSQSVPTIQDVTDDVAAHSPAIQEFPLVDEDGDATILSAPSAPFANDIVDVDVEIEEQMFRAAIEASKLEASSSPENIAIPTDALSQASKSEDGAVQLRLSDNSTVAKVARVDRTWKGSGRPGPLNVATSSRSKMEHDGKEDSEEHSLTRHRSSRRRGSAVGDGWSVNRSSSTPGLHNNSRLNGNMLSDEWGGISSEERSDAVMLEAALFGGVPESSTYPFGYHSQTTSEGNGLFYPRIPRSPSPTLVAQRMLKEQQDCEYFASLEADKEKELKAIQEAKHRHSVEEAAKEAALEQERLKKEEAERKFFEEQYYESELAVKEASLPPEPGSDDENAVTLLVRMADGSRQGRRFLKSDKLQYLFDFIDVGKVVKSNTYRLVRPYPRRAFDQGDKELTLSELGLTSKQEALFLEMI